MKYKGSCLCREITFEITGEFESFYLCHCKLCRKDTGSAHAANMFSSNAELRWLSGEDKVRTFQFRSTQHIKSFCSICGSAVPNIQMNGTLVVVPAGCLDSDVSLRPQGHIFYSHRANWDNFLDKLSKYDELPDEHKK